MPAESHVDDPTISDDDLLWRRVPDWPNFLDEDKTSGHYRVASSAFDDDADGDPMSVVLAAEATVESVLEGHAAFCVVAFSAGFARRRQGQIIIRAPEEDQPAHARVVGRKTHGVRRAFARVAR